jgi:Arc/MetJ-type ribon-helix-helix transcriptional regulator
MTRKTTSTLTISLPHEMLAELDHARKAEHASRSGLVREALRCYVAGRGRDWRVGEGLPEDEELEDRSYAPSAAGGHAWQRGGARRGVSRWRRTMHPEGTSNAVRAMSAALSPAALQ